MYSMIANLTLHLVSSASSTMAGRRDWDNCWIPITSLTQSKLEMIFNLTSGHSSFSWLRKSGSKCSIVLKKMQKKSKNYIQSEHLDSLQKMKLLRVDKLFWICWATQLDRFKGEPFKDLSRCFSILKKTKSHLSRSFSLVNRLLRNSFTNFINRGELVHEKSINVCKFRNLVLKTLAVKWIKSISFYIN